MTKQFKSWSFIAVFFLNFAYHAVLLSQIEEASPAGEINPYDRLTGILLYCVLAVLNVSLYGKKFYYHKGIKIFIAGVLMYLLWGICVMIGGLAVFNSFQGIYIIFKNFVRAFLTANIITMLNAKKNFLRVILITWGTLFLVMFATHFNGFDFLSSLKNLLGGSGRSRYSYGLGHVNYAAMICFYYFALLAVYKAELEDSHDKNYRDIVFLYCVAVSPLALIILLNTGSRAYITGLVLLYLVYYAESIYSKTDAYLKINFAVLSALSIAAVIFLVDWQMVYYLSNRSVNYILWLSYMSSKRAWLTGIGFLHWASFLDNVGFRVLDGSYLILLMQSGLVGLCLFMLSLFVMIYYYFEKNYSLTKAQKIIGGLFIAVLYQEIFQSTFLLGGTLSAEIWALIIASLNEKCYSETIRKQLYLKKCTA